MMLLTAVIVLVRYLARQFAAYQRTLSVSVRKLVCHWYKFASFTAGKGKWQQEKKKDPAPKLMTYALTWSFSHVSHPRSRSQNSKTTQGVV